MRGKWVFWGLALVLVGGCGAEPSTGVRTGGDAGTGHGAGDGTATGTGAGADAGPGTATDSAGAADAKGEVAAPAWHGPCAADKRVGRFEVLQDAEYGGSVAGNVADRVDALQVMIAKESADACQLWQRKAAVCSPGCTASQQCVRGAGCQAYPAPLDVGKVVVSGLVKPVEMTAKGANKDYFFTDFDADPFVPGGPIALQSGASQLAAFALHGYGIEPLMVATKSGQVQKGKPLTVSWTPGGGNGQIHVSINVDQHGLTPVTLTCDVADTGTLQVPVALTDALLGYGVSGAATATIERRTVDSVAVTVPDGAAACVELAVASRVSLQLLAQ